MKEETVIENLLEQLPALKDKEVELERASGLTNVVYIVKVNGQAEYIFKCFSQGYPSAFEQKITNILSNKKVIPHIEFTNKAYRIERFVKYSRHPEHHQIVEQKLLKRIMQKLYAIHELELPDDPKEHKIISKEVFGEEQYQSILKLKEKKVDDKHYGLLLGRILNILQKRELWKQCLLPQKEDYVVCHNDLNNLNIMVAPDDVFLIDYDYVGFNYVGFDIANMINETSLDYSVPAPGFKLIKTYTLAELQNIVKHYPKYYAGLESEVLRMLCVANLYWAIWSLERYQLNVSDVFDMLKHGIQRMDLFERYQGLIDNK